MAAKKKGKGRPTKYRPEYCQDIINFFSKQLNTKKPSLPFFSAYAREISIDVDTLQEWKKVHKDFSLSYSKCKKIQEEILTQGGLNRTFDAGFAWRTGKNICGWRDVKEIKQDIKTEHDVSPALADMFNKMYKGEAK